MLQMFAVGTGQLSSVERGRMSAVETRQMSAAETGQLSAVLESSGFAWAVRSLWRSTRRGLTGGRSPKRLDFC